MALIDVLIPGTSPLYSTKKYVMTFTASGAAVNTANIQKSVIIALPGFTIQNVQYDKPTLTLSIFFSPPDTWIQPLTTTTKNKIMDVLTGMGLNPAFQKNAETDTSGTFIGNLIGKPVGDTIAQAAAPLTKMFYITLIVVAIAIGAYLFIVKPKISLGASV